MNFSIQKTPIFLLILTIFTHISTAFHWDGNILYDLETTTESDFATEASQWFLSSYYTTPGFKYYKCVNDYLLGGFEVLGGSGLTGSDPYDGQYYERTYSSVPVHNQIYLQMRFFQLDTWDTASPPLTYWSDHFDIAIDGNDIYGWDLSFIYPGLSQICGLPDYQDFIFKIALTYPHSASSLTLQMIVHSDESSYAESFGFRDLSIEFLTNTSPYFSLCAPGVTSSYLSDSCCQGSCISSGNSITPASYGFCFPSSSCSTNCLRCSDTITTCTCCQTGWYLIDTTCYPACDYPLTTKTLGGVIYCETPCSGQYVWWDQSCSASCSYTTTYGSYAIVGMTTNTFLECTYPCATTEFLYWNTSCLSSCPTPLTTTPYKGRNFCEYPCSSSDYLYWNGSCLSTCDSPLISEIQGSPQQKKFCWFPCPDTQFLYWNGSCLSTCPSPLSSETQGTTQQRKFCWYTCSETQYLYWNGSCIDSCQFPLAPEKQQGVSSSRNFCWYPCAETDFLFWNGSCLSTCPSPLSPETQGLTQQRSFCWYPCSATQYLYWNESCLDSCPYPLIPEKQQGISSSRNFCWYSCQPSEFLYWNGSCLSTCPSPLASEIQGASSQQRNFCWYPCQPSEYLYWNESCVNNCPYPLAPETQGTSQQRNFCWYTCQPSEHLYWNGSCINNCPLPLSSETQGLTQQRDFCWYTCQPSEYLYWNQSCSNHCSIPLISHNLSGNQFCFLPCDMPNIYWYQDLSCRSQCPFPYNLIFHESISQCLKPCNRPSEYFYDLEKECHDTCDPPYVRQIINTIKVCHIDRSTLEAETNKIKSKAQAIETLGKVTSTILKVTSIPQLSTPRSALLIQLSALMQYIRYMRINYPWRVQLLFQSNDVSMISLNIDFSIPNKIQDKFDNYPLPDVFEKYSLNSNFINNMWDLLNTSLLVILSILALLLLKPRFKKSPKVSSLLTRVLQSLRWNIPLAMISGGTGEIIFFASLQIKNTPIGSAISIISFLISLLMIFWIIVVLVICLRILRGFHLHKQKISPGTDIKPTSDNNNKNWLKKWIGYEVLYEEIEERYLFSLAYMVIYMIRAIFFFTIIANAYEYPLAQSILINIVNLSIFIYLLSYKPLKDLWNTIQLFINEILGNIITICVLVLAIMDRAEIEARYSRSTIGNVMIIIIFIFYILGVVFLVIEGVLFLIEAYKTWKELRARGIKSPWRMIQILLFGEPKKIHPEKITLELSQNSSQLDSSPVHFKHNPLQKSDFSPGIKGKDSSVVSDVPLDSTARFFFPIQRVKLTEFDVQNTEDEISTSRIKRSRRVNLHQIEVDLNEENGINHNQSVFSANIEHPTLQPNVDYIQNWGNLKSRMKRFNQSIHKIHWSNHE